MRRLVSLLVLVVLAVALGATPAGAHAEVRDADPSVEGRAPTGTEQIEITFISMDASEPVNVSVLGPDGDDVVSGDVAVGEPAPTGTTVTVPTQPLADGVHVVEWQAMSSDGDGISTGSYRFTVEPAAGSGFGMWLIWIVALAIPAAIFLRPKGRKNRRPQS